MRFQFCACAKHILLFYKWQRSLDQIRSRFLVMEIPYTQIIAEELLFHNILDKIFLLN